MDFTKPLLALLEGMGLIASPCILPILPLILGTSIEGGRKRPFGIILGFIIAFTLFAFFSRALVNAFHINLNWIKYGSLILLSLLGLILLSERLSDKFNQWTQRVANIGLTNHQNAGFFSGIFIGMLIGCVWTPCAGPILAAVLVQIIRAESNLSAIIILTAFSLGAGLPMLIITLLGRRIMGSVHILSRHSLLIRKIMGTLIILTAFWIAFGNTAIPSSITNPQTSSLKNGLFDPVSMPYPTPELKNIEGWINTSPFTLSSLKGKVILVDFWTYSCINCIRTLPHITDWDKKYRNQGLVIVGVHSPEFEFEKNLSNVERAIKEYHIEYPVVLDNKLDTWINFNNHYWPAHYLIDTSGNIISTHFGEGHYLETENNIRHLLGLTPLTENNEQQSSFSTNQTPETYLGNERSDRFASTEPYVIGTRKFTIPTTLPLHNWALNGKWEILKEKIIAKEPGASITLHFNAAQVFLVLGSASDSPKTAHIIIQTDNPSPHHTEATTLEITSHKLYKLLQFDTPQSGTVTIEAQSADLEAYAFTFGA